MARVATRKAVLTADGGSNGILTIADTSVFVKGATVFLGATGLPTVELELASILSPTTMAVKLRSSPSARYNSSGYTTALSATVVQPDQDVMPFPPERSLGAVTTPAVTAETLRATTSVTAPTVTASTSLTTPLVTSGTSSLSLRSDVPDGASAVGVIVGPTIDYAVSGAKPISFRKGSWEMAYFTKDSMFQVVGNIGSSNAVSGGMYGASSLSPIHITGNMTNSALAIGVEIVSGANLTVSGGKIASFVNSTTEKLAVDKDGNLKFQNAGIMQYGSGVFSFNSSLSNTNGSDGAVTTDFIESFGDSNGYAGHFYAKTAFEGGIETDRALTFTSFGDSTATPGSATLNTPAGKSVIAAGASSLTITNNLIGANGIVYAVVQSNDANLTTILRTTVSAGSFVIVGNANANANTQVRWTILHTG